MAFVKRQALEARRDEVALRQMRVLRKLSALDLELAVTHEGQEQVGEARRGGVEMLIKSRELEEMAEVNKRKRAVELERFKQEAAKEDEIKRLEDEEQVRAMEAAAPTPEILAKVLKQWPDAPPESVVTSLCEIRRRLRGLLDNEAEERQRLQREERELLRELLNCGWELVLDERELPKDTSHALSVHKVCVYLFCMCVSKQV